MNLHYILLVFLLMAYSFTTINLPASFSIDNLPDLVEESINVSNSKLEKYWTRTNAEKLGKT